GTRCNSLSAIARKITGTAWSGPLFFGLKQARSVVTADLSGAHRDFEELTDEMVEVILSQVRKRLAAGGDSLERTRLWRPIPCYTGKYRELRQVRGSTTDQTVQIGRKTRGLQRSSLCRLTGNFLRPNRDLNRAIRVIFGLIRELGAGAPAPDLAAPH